MYDEILGLFPLDVRNLSGFGATTGQERTDRQHQARHHPGKFLKTEMGGEKKSEVLLKEQKRDGCLMKE